MGSFYLRGIPTDPVTLTTTAAGGAQSSGQVYGALHQVRLTYSGADGSTTAAIAVVRGSDAETIITVTGNTDKSVFPRGTNNTSNGADAAAANTEAFLVAGETIRLTVTGNGTVTAVVKLLS